jgi:hypothetical protein
LVFPVTRQQNQTVTFFYRGQVLSKDKTKKIKMPFFHEKSVKKRGKKDLKKLRKGEKKCTHPPSALAMKRIFLALRKKGENKFYYFFIKQIVFKYEKKAFCHLFFVLVNNSID